VRCSWGYAWGKFANSNLNSTHVLLACTSSLFVVPLLCQCHLAKLDTADYQQFFDVVNLMSKIGLPSDKHMIVFNGDLVDRGSWSGGSRSIRYFTTHSCVDGG
jgi:hypothetical protein